MSNFKPCSKVCS